MTAGAELFTCLHNQLVSKLVTIEFSPIILKRSCFVGGDELDSGFEESCAWLFKSKIEAYKYEFRNKT